jgi:heat shock protein HslJ
MIRPYHLLALLAGCAPVTEAPLQTAAATGGASQEAREQAASGAEPAAVSELLGSWRIVSLDGRQLPGGSTPDRAPGLFFGPGHYGGNSGCNAFGGMGVFDGERYYGGPALQTLIGCSALEAQERAILTLMGSAPRVGLNADGRLTLSHGARTMVLERLPAPPPRPHDPWGGTPLLAGTRWSLDALDGTSGGARVRMLAFEADRWTLTSPCGTRSGAWRQAEQRIIAEVPDPRPVASCSAEAAAVDARLLAMIDADPRFVTGPNGEILIGGGGHWVTGDGPPALLKQDVPLGGTFGIVAVDGAPPTGESPLWIEFRQTEYRGLGGCNSFEGIFLAHSRRLFADAPVLTRKACGDALAAQEKRITSVLANGPRVGFGGNGDILLIDQTGSLRLKRQTAMGSWPLTGTLWRGEPMEVELTRLNGQPLQERGSDPAFRLRLTGRGFDLDTGCGRLGGIWRVRAGEPEFLTHPAPDPTGACAPALAERLPLLSRLFNGRGRILVGAGGEFILAGEQHWLTGRVLRGAPKR